MVLQYSRPWLKCNNVNLDHWNLFIAIVSLGLTYQVRIIKVFKGFFFVVVVVVVVVVVDLVWHFFAAYDLLVLLKFPCKLTLCALHM